MQILTISNFLKVGLAVLFLSECGCPYRNGKAAMSISKTDFGITQDGQKAKLYTLTNANGMVVKITNYGGVITELWVPDKNGNPGDI